MIVPACVRVRVDMCVLWGAFLHLCGCLWVCSPMSGASVNVWGGGCQHLLGSLWLKLYEGICGLHGKGLIWLGCVCMEILKTCGYDRGNMTIPVATPSWPSPPVTSALRNPFLVWDSTIHGVIWIIRGETSQLIEATWVLRALHPLLALGRTSINPYGQCFLPSFTAFQGPSSPLLAPSPSSRVAPSSVQEEQLSGNPESLDLVLPPTNYGVELCLYPRYPRSYKKGYTKASRRPILRPHIFQL